MLSEAIGNLVAVAIVTHPFWVTAIVVIRACMRPEVSAGE